MCIRDSPNAFGYLLMYGVENLIGSTANDSLTGSSDANTLTGAGGNDTLSGLDGNDTLLGGAGDDSLTGGLGDDILNGGIGFDRAIYSGSANATVNLAVTIAQNTGYGMDTLLSIENLTTDAGNDRLTGNSIANQLDGGAGNDMLIGGLGNDTLTGGAGQDAFVFHTAIGAANIDTITDFNVVDDTIRLENAIFTGLAAGTLDPAAFVANLTGLATTADQHVIYETDTGNLFYDSNGSAAGGSVLFAVLAPGLALTNADFLVY